MSNLIEKYRVKKFEVKQPYDKVVAICKLKKLDDNEKFKKCLDVVGNYYLTKHKARVNYETYECYYERFVVNGKKDEVRFAHYFDSINESINYLICLRLFGCVNALQNINIEKLTENEKSIYNNILKCVKNYFPENFDYKHYYFYAVDAKGYKKESHCILNEVIQDYKLKTKQEKDLFSVNNVEEFEYHF